MVSEDVDEQIRKRLEDAMLAAQAHYRSVHGVTFADASVRLHDVKIGAVVPWSYDNPCCQLDFYISRSGMRRRVFDWLAALQAVENPSVEAALCSGRPIVIIGGGPLAGAIATAFYRRLCGVEKRVRLTVVDSAEWHSYMALSQILREDWGARVNIFTGGVWLRSVRDNIYECSATLEKLLQEASVVLFDFIASEASGCLHGEMARVVYQMWEWTRNGTLWLAVDERKPTFDSIADDDDLGEDDAQNDGERAAADADAADQEPRQGKKRRLYAFGRMLEAAEVFEAEVVQIPEPETAALPTARALVERNTPSASADTSTADALLELPADVSVSWCFKGGNHTERRSSVMVNVDRRDSVYGAAAEEALAAAARSKAEALAKAEAQAKEAAEAARQAIAKAEAEEAARAAEEEEKKRLSEARGGAGEPPPTTERSVFASTGRGSRDGVTLGRLVGATPDPVQGTP